MDANEYFRKVYLLVDRYIYYLRHDKAFDDNEKERINWLDTAQDVLRITMKNMNDEGD